MTPPTQSEKLPTTPLERDSKGPDVEALYRYLKKYGYFPNDELKNFTQWRPNMAFDPDDVQLFDETFEQAVKLFQRQQGLKVDGVVGPKTLALMAQPRCGFPDVVPASTSSEAPAGETTSDEFRVQGNRWSSNTITYHFDNVTSDVPAADARAAIQGAFHRWAAVTPLMFTESTGPSDVRIGWYSGNHGDGSNFDGAGNILAHCFYPPPNGGDIAGDCHFDEAETWSVNTPPSGIDLATVALHEIGHGLGLAHSDVASSVMYAFYGGVRRELTADDIAGIQSIYGARFRWASLGGTISDPVVASNQDGRLEVFAKGADNGLWHIWQTAPSNGWSGWASLGGGMGSKVAVGMNADGRLDIFVRGTDGALWHTWQTAPNSGWSAWASLGGVIQGMPAVGRNADGRLEVFARGNDGALWHKWQVAPNGTWSGWASLGGTISDAVVASNQDGRLEVFAKGADNGLWHMWQTAPSNGWSGWESLGGVLAGKVTVGKNSDGRLEVFVRGTNGALWHKWQVAPNSTWSGWASLGGIVDEPAVINNADGRLELFVRGADNGLWHMWQTAPSNGWSGWATLGGQLIGGPVPARNKDGRLECLVRGLNNALWTTWQSAPNNGWM
ncbi:MAG TPA: matrixin family metalloprotease [Acidimicrobiia bacterium]|nr:matrixin family metalloprotease [Acidimicrobiia bacterium]